MIRWFFGNRYSPFDTIWLIWAVLAWHDGHRWAAFASVVIGAMLSGFIETAIEHKDKPT